jgi:hypothetical protein
VSDIILRSWAIIHRDPTGGFRPAPIISIDGEIVRTRKTAYRLEGPAEEYLAWRRAQGLPVDRDALLASVRGGCDGNRVLGAA